MLAYKHTLLYSPVYLAILLVVDLDELAEPTGVVVVCRFGVAERLRVEPEIVTTGANRQPTDKTAAIGCSRPAHQRLPMTASWASLNKHKITGLTHYSESRPET